MKNGWISAQANLRSKLNRAAVAAAKTQLLSNNLKKLFDEEWRGPQDDPIEAQPLLMRNTNAAPPDHDHATFVSMPPPIPPEQYLHTFSVDGIRSLRYHQKNPI